MRNGKYQKSSKKALAALLALVLLVGGIVGGTIAWLTDTTDAVVNTFTPSDIEITLTETKGLNSEGKWENEMIPGVTYDKDPVVAVDGSKTDVDCYLFVRFLEENNAQTYLNYTSLLTTEAGWTQVPNTTDVWYRVVKVDAETKEWHLLENDQITVDGAAVTSDNMTDAASAKLTYTAYAIQYQGFENDVPGAWAAAYAQQTSTT